MASFYTIFGFLSVSTFEYSEPGSFDILSSLPEEVANEILRLLPGKDLLTAALVNKRWLHLIKGNSNLRHKVRCHIRKEMKARLDGALSGNRRTGRQHSRMTNGAAVPIRNMQFPRERGCPTVKSQMRYVPYNPKYNVWNKCKPSSPVVNGNFPRSSRPRVRI